MLMPTPGVPSMFHRRTEPTTEESNTKTQIRKLVAHVMASFN